MILTVTPNPALDYTIRLDSVDWGRRARYRDPVIDPSGKGVNVSRMVRRLGGATAALGIAGGRTGDLLREGLDREGVPHAFIPCSAPVRINVTLRTGPEGTATHLHGPGGAVTAAEVEILMAEIRARLPGAAALVLSGSLPPGMPASACGDLVRAARGAGVVSIVDLEGSPLGEALAAGPSVVKVNLGEAREFLGGEPEAETAARTLVVAGAGAAVVTSGAEGAVGVGPEGAWRARPPREPGVRAVGAGDSFAAGFALGMPAGLAEAMRLGSAAGAATARAPGSGLGSREDAERLRPLVELTRLR
jgi:1-phosphofructokinase family hexose kinase